MKNLFLDNAPLRLFYYCQYIERHWQVRSIQDLVLQHPLGQMEISIYEWPSVEKEQDVSAT